MQTDNILLSASLFGSTYLFSKSLEMINAAHVTNKRVLPIVIAVCVTSGSMFYLSFSRIVVESLRINRSK